MAIIKVQTLIDVTDTRVNRLTQGTQLELNQNRNFITLKQCIELRSIVTYDSGPSIVEFDITGLGFGTNFEGKHRVWTFIFHPDREDVYRDETDNIIGLLFEDIHAVPIIKNLTETINIDKAIFDLKDAKAKNTIIKALQADSQAMQV
jgi:hypothetical protein